MRDSKALRGTNSSDFQIRMYTLLTVGTIICYMYYAFLNSSFQGLRYKIGVPKGFTAPDSQDQQDGSGGMEPIDEVSQIASTVDVGSPTSSPITIPTDAAPSPETSGFWLANMQHRGVAPYHHEKDYKVFRNVRDYGAKGDGETDDAEAINKAISDGSRCGKGCDSSTISPAVIYFPPGKYLVSEPIIALYYTQLIGDPIDMPILYAKKGFEGPGVIDTDPYGPTGQNWYVNQNNFFRAIRNFIIDLTGMDEDEGTGIHHQVAQATSIYNVIFKLHEGLKTRQRGIFMDNGSGGFLSSLKFYGGEAGAFFGNQQFTTVDLEFHRCKTAIYIHWDWVWLLKSIKIFDCGRGIDITSGGPDKLAVGSVLLLDSHIENTPMGIRTFRYKDSQPPAAGTLVIQNLVIKNVKVAVSGWNDDEIFGGTHEGQTTTIPFWAHGKGYSDKYPNGDNINVVADETQDSIPKILKDEAGKIFERPRPLYRHISSNRFISVKEHGAIGDGEADDSAAIQEVLSTYGNTQEGQKKKIIFFDYGVYRVSRTIYVPPNTYITGEAWSTIMSSGSLFNDASNPKPVFQVGEPGEEGVVEISDLLLQTQGPAAGAVLMEWNIRSPEGKNVSGMWDVHFRVGGSHETHLQSDRCSKSPNSEVHAKIDDQCVAAFMLLHIGKTASLYMENMWLWTSDHDLDADDHAQISIYTGRGLLCEAEKGPVWMYGHAVEHNVLYNYQLLNTKNVFMGVIQTETPYFQSNPRAREPFTPSAEWHDPDLEASCGLSIMESTESGLCEKSWGLRILNSSDVFAFGAGLYSFFENYSTDCIETRTCQQTMVTVQGDRKSETIPSRSNIWLLGLNTIGTQNFISWVNDTENVVQIKADETNKNGYTDTVGLILL